LARFISIVRQNEALGFPDIHRASRQTRCGGVSRGRS